MSYARYVFEGAQDAEHERAAKYYSGDKQQDRDTQDSAIRLREDMAPELAALLGIDVTRPLTVTEAAHLMNLRTAGGEEIEGRKKHSPHQSVAEVFGLAAKSLPSVAEIENVLAGKRADGEAPRASTGNGAPLSDKRVASSLRQFKIAIGVPPERDATPEEIQRLADGRINVADYHKKISVTAPAVGFVDLTFSSDKSVGICYALAETDAERELIKAAVHAATDDAMAYAESVLGMARRGAGGTGAIEPAHMTWIGFQHYTSRPATDIVRLDAQGQEYTDTRSVPGAADVNLHQHRIVPSTILTPDGHVGSLDLSRLKGEVKVMGAVFHAGIATRLNAVDIKTEIGPNGEARIVGIPEWVRKFHSQRTIQGEDAAKAWAQSQGKDWTTLSGDEKAKLLSEGVAKTREAKTPQDKRANDEGRGDIAMWQAEAKAAGYKHKSVLRTLGPVPDRTQEERVDIAYRVSIGLLDKAFQKRSVLSDGDVREIAARGFIVAGLGANAADDINMALKAMDERGVNVNGIPTRLIRGTDLDANGRQRHFVTTERAIEQEEGLIELVRTAALNKSKALTPEQIDRAAERFLAAHPYVDATEDQWKSQLKMAHDIGEGGQVSLSIGVAGSGKTSTVVAILVDAWHEQGRMVYGLTVPWKASTALRDAGVDQAVAIEAFLRRVEKGDIHVDENTVIVADEVSQIGLRHQIALLKLVTETGAQLVEIGDPRQCAAIETPAIDLMAKAIGDESIPKLLTTIRQKTQRDRDIATMFRDGKAADGISALQEDGRFHLVAGGKDRTIEHTTALWRKLTNANADTPNYTLLVMTPTNAQALEVGMAIRTKRQELGEIGRTGAVLKAKDPNSGQTFDLPVSVGDKLRMFTRTYDADTPGRTKVLSSNGDVVQITEILETGLRIKNESGDDGRITWAQMKPFRAPKNDPVHATLGYAVTIDTAQSLTRSAAIVVAPDGSKQVSGYKAYTALSRHVGEVYLVISDAAERLEIIGRQMIGRYETPSREDVVRNVAVNFSRFEKKSQAIDVLHRAIDVQREAITGVMQASEPGERQGVVRVKPDQAVPNIAPPSAIIAPTPTAEDTAIARHAALMASGRMSFDEALYSMVRRYERANGDGDLAETEARYSEKLSEASLRRIESGNAEDTAIARRAALIADDRMTFGEGLNSLLRRYERNGGDPDKAADIKTQYRDQLGAAALHYVQAAHEKAIAQIAEDTAIARRAVLMADDRMSFGEAMDSLLRRYERKGGDPADAADITEHYKRGLRNAALHYVEIAHEKAVTQITREAAWQAATPAETSAPHERSQREVNRQTQGH